LLIVAENASYWAIIKVSVDFGLSHMVILCLMQLFNCCCW